MKQHFTYLSADNSTQIHAIRWIPEGKITAVLQICHGMIEFIDRYDDFASFLNRNGILVTGNDHLGHGESVLSDDLHGYFAEGDGNQCVIADIRQLFEMTKKEYPDIPYFMLGHSMGSFLTRQYIEIYGKELSGAIIMGTGSQPAAALTAGKLLCRTLAKMKGWHYESPVMENMAFGAYNKRFEPARTSRDWLTKDEKIVDAYLANPWCTFHFSVNAYYHMFRGIEYIQNPEHMKCMPKTLPVLFVSGAEDPVGNYGEGVRQVYRSFQQIGMKDVQIHIYENDRHELLNELDRAQIYQDLLAWIETRSQNIMPICK